MVPRKTSPFTIPHLGPSIAGRLLSTWLGVRVVIAALTAIVIGFRGPRSLLIMPASSSAITVLVVVGLFWLTTRRRNEDLFLRTLGYDTLPLIALFVALTLLLELLTQALGRLVF